MQRCPKCNRTYQDDAQKFCTFDGGRLMVDAQAPTSLDLGPPPQSDPLGATVMGPAPDLNRTVAANNPPLTSEISPSAPTAPTGQPTTAWPNTPPSHPPTASTGPTTTSPLAPPPPPVSSQQAGTASVPTPAQSGNVTAAPGIAPQTGPVSPPMAAPQSAPLPAPTRKSSRMLLVVGGLAVLFLLLIAGGAGFYFLAMKPKQAAANTNSGRSGSSIDKPTATNTNANTSTTGRQAPVEAPPDSTKFVNSRDKLTGSLAEHFVDFSLYYPNSWTLDPKAGTSGSSNFFKADRMLSDDTGDYLLERVAVSWYQSNGTMQLDRPIFPNRVEFLNNLFSKDYPKYEKVSEGDTKFNDQDAYQFTFKSLVEGTGKGDINLWGRVIFLPMGNEEMHNGVTILMLASSAAPEIKSAEDVGVKGELPTILKTFRLGPSQ